jgi:hypothetical protein
MGLGLAVTQRIVEAHIGVGDSRVGLNSSSFAT